MIVTKYTKICAKHFSDVDFEKYSVDQCQSRQQKRDIQQLKKIRLKPFAVPHIFPGLPNYISKPVVLQRPTIASSSSRLDKENAEIQLVNKKNDGS